MSAQPEQPGIEKALTHGDTVRFLAKPFDINVLVATVESATAALPPQHETVHG